MRLTFRKVAYGVLSLYVAITCYTGIVLLKRRFHKERLEQEYARNQQLPVFVDNDDEWNPWGQEFENEAGEQPRYDPPDIQWDMKKLQGSRGEKSPNSSTSVIVEVWSKAAIGLYFWEHIMNGPLERRLGGIWSYGFKKINNIRFRFRTGPGVMPGKVPSDVENLILVLNGREPSKVDFAKMWLDLLPTLAHLKNVAVILLGNEKCNNEWIKPYMKLKGGPVKFVHLVYDSPDIDDYHFYQWPLGVATYRDFPKVDSAHLPINIHRKFSCNFIGTVYPNSSRVTLLDVVQKSPHGQTCYMKGRSEWLAQETDQTREDYLRTLAQSDLTLNPVGQNSECYRLYEAMSYGSVPVIEDQMTPGNCGPSESSKNAPHRLLKDHNAPVIFVKDWTELRTILEREANRTHQEIVERRKTLIQWYEDFKTNLRNRYTSIIKERFFGSKR